MPIQIMILLQPMNNIPKERGQVTYIVESNDQFLSLKGRKHCPLMDIAFIMLPHMDIWKVKFW
jgi:hypothetical protein